MAFDARAHARAQIDRADRASGTATVDTPPLGQKHHTQPQTRPLARESRSKLAADYRLMSCAKIARKPLTVLLLMMIDRSM